jgi:pyrroloquinoline quinone (PQQ) biosynthesis protein C
MRRTITPPPEALRAIRREVVDPAPLMAHPVVQARIKGELTLDQIRAIEIQHYYEARFFSTFVLNTVKNCNEDMQARKWMAENWVEEATGDDDHASLILRVLDALGVDAKQVEEMEPTPGMVAWHEILEGITAHRSFVEGVAALWIGEAEYPPVASALHTAYRDIYHVDAAGLATYKVHAEHDVGHGMNEESVITRYVEADPALLPKIRRAARDAYSAYLFSFDGYWQAATGRREFWPGLTPYV